MKYQFSFLILFVLMLSFWVMAQEGKQLYYIKWTYCRYTFLGVCVGGGGWLLGVKMFLSLKNKVVLLSGAKSDFLECLKSHVYMSFRGKWSFNAPQEAIYMLTWFFFFWKCFNAQFKCIGVCSVMNLFLFFHTYRLLANLENTVTALWWGLFSQYCQL